MKTLRRRSGRRKTVPLLLVLVCGVVVYLSLEPICFRSDAIVAITTQDPILRAAVMRTSIRDGISKSVLLRAASTLSDMPAPRPDVFESMAVTLGLTGSRPTGRDGRLANKLKDESNVVAGDMPGTIDISVGDPNASIAARLANAIAEAFIADQDDHVAELRRLRESALAARIDQLKASASAAYDRLSALGGNTDPVQIIAMAANRRIEAQNRLDAIQTILASGSPPLSDRKDIPESIAALEKTYFDLSSQLLKARETLGDRHTTIISLKEGVARSSSNLVIEWKRFERIVRAELDAARAQEANIRNTNPPLDASRQDAIDAARLAVRQADEGVKKAEASRYDNGDDGLSYKRLSPAFPAIDSNGFSRKARAMIATGSSLLLLVILAIMFGIRSKAGRAALQTATVPSHGGYLSFVADQQLDAHEKVEAPTPYIAHPMKPDVPQTRRPGGIGEGARQAAENVLKELEAVHPRYGVSTMMVAANESDAESRPVALDLAYTIAASGRRVLLVEEPRSEPELAANTDPDAAPILVDLFGTLRVMFRSDAKHGILYVVPSFKNEARITSVLARDRDISLVDKISDEFDILIYDGGRAGRFDMVTDFYLRVGRFGSSRADARFLEAFGEPDAVFIGTVVEDAFLAPETAKPSLVDAVATRPEPVALPPLPPSRAPMDRVRRARLERTVTAARRAGMRLS